MAYVKLIVNPSYCSHRPGHMRPRHVEHFEALLKNMTEAGEKDPDPSLFSFLN